MQTFCFKDVVFFARPDDLSMLCEQGYEDALQSHEADVVIDHIVESSPRVLCLIISEQEESTGAVHHLMQKVRSLKHPIKVLFLMQTLSLVADWIYLYRPDLALPYEALSNLKQHLLALCQHHRYEQLALSSPTQSPSSQGRFTTGSPAMLKTMRMVEKIAPTECTTLLFGASGTGKERLARYIHRHSTRRHGPFVALNCAAIPENLLESELFGFEKGAFTGAIKRSIGRIERAQNGTIFLDEIGDMPCGLQAKLLRFLQERVIERVGGHEEISLNVRILAATHRELPHMIAQGLFREDLFYRLSEMVVQLPRLKDRQEDIIPLAEYFIEHFALTHQSAVKSLSQGAKQALLHHDWPGNIRELENRIKRGCILCDHGWIAPEDIGLEEKTFDFNMKAMRSEVEKRALILAIQAFDGNISHASQALGITRPTFYNLMEKFKLDSAMLSSQPLEQDSI